MSTELIKKNKIEELAILLWHFFVQKALVTNKPDPIIAQNIS